MSMRVGLFGGSFNPPHVCHTVATLWALQTQRLDEVWWIPTYQHAFQKELVDFEHREAMCERAIAPIDNIRIKDVERDLGGESRTIDTLNELESRHPEVSFALLIGSDILEETHKWKQWDDLVERTDLVVIGRAGYEEDGSSSPLSSDFELPNVSSTRTRRALEERDRPWLETWIPTDVLDYIDEHDLYR